MRCEPGERRELLHYVPRNIEALTLKYDISTVDTWNWENKDPTAVAVAMIETLKSFDRGKFPKLRSIYLAWRGTDDERTPERREVSRHLSWGQEYVCLGILLHRPNSIIVPINNIRDLLVQIIKLAF